jgi:GNAT superfamily N-acetyltransferase
MAQIVVKEVLTKRELREFIYLPARVHKNDPGWLPPIYNDEWLLFNKKKNRSYQYADAAFFLAYKDSKVAGRIMSLVNNRYNSIKNERNGRFCFLDSINDIEVVQALLDTVEQWVKDRGMVKIVGPLGFSDKDPQGFQIEGFEYPYLFTAATNSQYLPAMMESFGYTKEVDLVNYNIPMPYPVPALYLKAYDRFSKNGEFKVIEFRSKKEIKPYIIPILELMNQTFSEIYGFVPLNDPEKQEFASRYLPILDPEFVKLVSTGDQYVGFIIALPDLSKGIIAAKGKLFPFGLFRILNAMKKSKKLMLMLGGIRKDYRGHGIDVLMAIKMLESARHRNMTLIDSHLILENNVRMRAECDRLEGKIVKRFRIYQKQLQNLNTNDNPSSSLN